MIDKNQLVKYIIQPSLKEIGMYSKSAEMLLLYTAATESLLGKYLKQIGGGPALGLYEMEIATYYCNWENNLRHRRALRKKLLSATGYGAPPSASHLIWDMKLSTLMARVHYARFDEALPDYNDYNGLVAYYYKYWRPNREKTSLSEAKQRIEKVLYVGNHV